MSGPGVLGGTIDYGVVSGANFGNYANSFGSYLYVESGGVAQHVTLDYAYAYVESGGSAKGTVVNSDWVYVYSGGSASGSILNNGAYQTVLGVASARS